MELKMKISFIAVFILASGLFHMAHAQTITGDDKVGLSEAIDRALENATATRIAKADKEAAESANSVLSSDYLPKVSSSLSYTRYQYPQIVTPIRERGVFPPLDDQIYDATIRAEWQFFDFGESRAARRSAMALARAANIQYELAKMETIEATASNFVRLQQLKTLNEVQEERIETLKRTRKQLEALFQKGRVAKVDLLKIEETIIEAETAVLATRNDIEETLQVLAHDLGLKQPISTENLVPLTFYEDITFDPDKVVADDVPPIAASREQWQASKLDAKASYRAFLPQLNLFAAEQFRSGASLDIDDQWMVGVQVELPLFSGKTIINNQVKRSKSKAKKAELEQTRQRYVQQLNALTNAQFEAQKRIEASEARSKFLEETYRIEKAAYEEGRTTLTDLLTTESKLNEARAELIGMRAQLRFVNLNIAVLTGQLNKRIAIKLAEGRQL